jgi:hypothetical protein
LVLAERGQQRPPGRVVEPVVRRTVLRRPSASLPAPPGSR